MSLALAAAALATLQVTEFKFPLQPISPRAVAVGGAGAAPSRDAEAALNPAALRRAPHLSLRRFEGYAGYGGFLLAGNVDLFGELTAGVSIRRFAWDRLVEDDLGPGTADLDASELAVSAGASASLARSLDVGVSFAWLAADNFGVVTSAPSFSMGAIARYNRRGSLGVAIRTMGPAARTAGGGEHYPLPTRARAGLAQGFALRGSELTVFADVESRFKGRMDPSVHIGAELRPFSALALRGGYESVANPDVAGARDERWSTGVGIRVGPLDLGLAARFGGVPDGYETFIGLDLVR